MKRRFASFAEFFPFYLSEHRNATCRKLHFAGTSLRARLGRGHARHAAVVARVADAGRRLRLRLDGHFFFEKNRPATFTYPGWSFVADFVMYWQLLTGKIPFEERNPRAG